MEVHEAGDKADVGVAARATRSAILDAAHSGADLTAAALGAVEGAISVAGLLGVPARDAASTASAAAVDVAREAGEGAAIRVRRALRERFGSHNGR